MYVRWKFFYESGKILCAGSYMNGKGHGSTKLIDTIPQEGISGLWTYWDNDGLLSAKKHYDKGKPWGQYTTYHQSGHKITDGVVRGLDDYGNLIKDGKWLFWDDNGLLKEEVHFNEGKREGLTTYFSI